MMVDRGFVLYGPVYLKNIVSVEWWNKLIMYPLIVQILIEDGIILKCFHCGDIAAHLLWNTFDDSLFQKRLDYQSFPILCVLITVH